MDVHCGLSLEPAVQAKTIPELTSATISRRTTGGADKFDLEGYSGYFLSGLAGKTPG